VINLNIWNLTPDEWARGLLKIDSPEQVATNVARGRLVPWSRTLFLCTQERTDVLDLGSGTGQHSAYLSRNGRRMTLLDFSNDNLKFGSRVFKIIGSNGHFIQSDMKRPLPFRDNSFDTVFSVGVLEYFTDKEINRVLKECFRISRRNIIVMVPNSFSIAYRIGRLYSKATHQWKWGGERPFHSLRSYFRDFDNIIFNEFTVGTKQSLDFLTMFRGLIRRVLLSSLRLRDSPTPSSFRQGFVLVSFARKTVPTGAPYKMG